jgi:hypothetical protein
VKKPIQEPEGFAAFWNLWRPHARNTDGRGLARETFAKHVRAGADPEDIVLGAAWFLRTMKEKDREFIPLSSTWLNRGSYEDLCEHERKYQDALSGANVVQMQQASRAVLPANHFSRTWKGKA